MKYTASNVPLEPIFPIPERELWFWKNPEVIASVQQGIQQVKTGELHDLGSFSQYADSKTDK